MEEVKSYLKKLGYEEAEIEKIINDNAIARLKPETLIKNIERNYNYVLTLGYGQEEIIKMTKSLPTIYGYSIENIQQKIEDLKKLGYSQEEVIKMTKSSPSIYSHSIENIQQKIEDLKKVGYSQEEVIKMTKSLPAIYGYSIENIKQKVEFYNSINLHSIIINDTKQLMQSTALSYARYMFYKEKGIEINETNYRKLFMGQKRFENQYGVTKQEILEKYDYKKYLERQEKKSTQELGKETLEEQKNTELLDEIEKAQQEQQKEIESRKEK